MRITLWGRLAICGRLVIGPLMNSELLTGRLPIGRRLPTCPTRSVVLFLLFACIMQAQDEMAHAQRLKSTLLGIDTHIDTIQRVMIGHLDLGQRLPDGQIDLPRLAEGGTHAPFFALWVPTYFKGAEAVRRTLDLRDAMQSVFDRYPDRIQLATTGADLERIVKSGKI